MLDGSVRHQSATLAVSEVGAGQPVVFLHAGVTDRRCWFEVMGLVGSHARTIAYDRRGYGTTSYAAEPHSDVDDLMAVLADRQIEGAVLVGVSGGGMLALEAAIRRPGRVAGLVLVNWVPEGGSPTEPGEATEDLARRIEEAEAAGNIDLANELEARLWLDGPASPGRVNGPARELFLDMNGQAWRASDTGPGTPPTAVWEDLARLKMPTLIILGTLDIPPIVARAREAVGMIPDAALHEIDRAAHLPMLERPREVADAISAFLDRIST